MALNYVKFQRGTQTAYNRLKASGLLEPNALYFIYDQEHLNEGGSLYLGNILIGGTNSNTGSSYLSNLLDVGIDNTPSPGAILQYNNLTGLWESASIKTAIENSGTTFIHINSTNSLQDEELEDSLARINNNPNEGDISFINNTPYIYNGNTWQLLTGTSLDEKITRLENQIITITTNIQDLQGNFAAVDGLIAEAISQANHLKYQIKNELPSLDEVGSLSNTILLIPNENGEEGNSYSEYMVVNGNFERLGDWSVNLDGYVTTNTFNSTVGSLTNQINALTENYLPITTYRNEVGDLSELLSATGKESTTIVDEIIELHGRLQWNSV